MKIQNLDLEGPDFSLQIGRIEEYRMCSNMMVTTNEGSDKEFQTGLTLYLS